VRVSTKDQHLAQQFRQLRALAESRGYRIVKVYKEKRSAFKTRPAHKAIMADAAMRRVDVVLVWSIDRFARHLIELLSNVEDLDRRGVRFVSLRESAIDTTEASGKYMLAVLGAGAQFERARLIERTHVGLEAARRAGKILGRRPSARWHDAQGRAWHAAGVSAAEIGRRLGLSARTVLRKLRGEKGTDGGPENSQPQRGKKH